VSHELKHNLTVTVDAGVLRRARIKALEQGTSVNAVVRAYLEAFAGLAPDRRAIEDFLALTKGTKASSGRRGRTWTRDDLYDRRG
jgi:hypothetical protein